MGKAVPTAGPSSVTPLIDSDTPREAQPGGWGKSLDAQCFKDATAMIVVVVVAAAEHVVIVR
jgi:hypothetical protein